MLFQNRTNNLTLDAFAAAVDDADFIDAGANALFDILFHNAGYILRRKGVKIDRVFDGKDDRLVEGRIGFLKV